MKRVTYTGIGSRRAPDSALHLGYEIAKMMAFANAVLRSGSAPGMDISFEDGARHANGSMEIYLPWPKFEGSSSEFKKPSERALMLASNAHPNWFRLAPSEQALHGRNVLGWLCDQPSDFVVCWTKDGAEKGYECGPNTGGTATAIRTAWAKCVPVFNLQRPDAYGRMFKHLESLQ